MLKWSSFPNEWTATVKCIKSVISTKGRHHHQYFEQQSQLDDGWYTYCEAINVGDGWESPLKCIISFCVGGVETFPLIYFSLFEDLG